MVKVCGYISFIATAEFVSDKEEIKWSECP